MRVYTLMETHLLLPIIHTHSIFSKIEFSSLELDPRLVKVLESSEKEGGFGLKRATKVVESV